MLSRSLISLQVQKNLFLSQPEDDLKCCHDLRMLTHPFKYKKIYFSVNPQKTPNCYHDFSYPFKNKRTYFSAFNSRRLPNVIMTFMSQSIPAGYIPPPPGNPSKNLFERANAGHPGKFFCLIPCPGAKNDGRIPGGEANFLYTRRNYPLSLQKMLKKFRKI